jgi:hypothetical protein
MKDEYGPRRFSGASHAADEKELVSAIRFQIFIIFTLHPSSFSLAQA